MSGELREGETAEALAARGQGLVLVRYGRAMATVVNLHLRGTVVPRMRGAAASGLVRCSGCRGIPALCSALTRLASPAGLEYWALCLAH